MTSPSAELSIEAVSVRWFLQAVALVLTGMAALVAAAGSVEFPRNVDADTSLVLILVILGADVDAAIGNSLHVISFENIVSKDGNTQTFVLKELLTQTQIQVAISLGLARA